MICCELSPFLLRLHQSNLWPNGWLKNFFDDDVLDSTVLAASLEDDVPPGLLLAEALDGLGPMVLP